jgi:hypothetical protein
MCACIHSGRHYQLHVSAALNYNLLRVSSTYVIHFLTVFNLLDFVKSNAGAGCGMFNPKVGSIPASRTIRGDSPRPPSLLRIDILFMDWLKLDLTRFHGHFELFH